MTSEAAGLFNSRASASTSTSFFSCLVGKSELTSPIRSPNFSEYLTFINFANAPNISTIPDHPDPTQQTTSQRLSSYFNKSSWHPWLSDCDSHFDRSSIYSSCPSINSSFSSEITPPPPPPRRSESFLCVSNHLYIRAVAAQRSYYDYLSFVSNLHRNFTMTQETGPTVNLINPSDDNQSFQTERSFDEDVPSPSHELTTPSYTPPPPIDSSYDSSLSPANTHESNGNACRKDPPMFIYSYDPPSPEIDSEYDPPFFSPPPSNLSKSDFQVNDQKEDEDLNKTSNAQPLMRPDSDLSSSTLSATLLLTQDSDVSPLPPHGDRVSSLNTDTLTSSSLNTLLATSDPSATYTCTSPAFSYNSDTMSTAPDLSKITMNDFDHQNAELENLTRNSPEEIEAKDSCTPDTICVSPLLSERASQSYSKTSEEPSLPTRSLSESRKKSTEGTGSSDRARRSSPPSSPDLSLSSLPSDTITMNTAIDSIGTDTDSNENPAPTHGNRNRASQSVHSQDETDQTTDSAFASPSTSPTCTLSMSSSVTPVPGREKKSASTERRTAKDSDEGFGKETAVAPSSDENIISDEASTTKGSREKSVESNSYGDLVDETAENESIYPESECEIRLVSRADTDVADPTQRDSSPDNHTTPIIAELCQLEEEKTDQSVLPEKCKESTIVRNLSSSSMKEISSSGNSSMSNSPALSADTNPGKKFVSHESKNEIIPNDNTHLNNWLHNSQSSEIHGDGESNYDSVDAVDASTGAAAGQDGIIIEEISSDLPSYFNGSRSLPSFGPLPTIHEVADTPTDNTPVSDAVTITSVDNVENITNPNPCYTETSSIISSFVHSDSLQAGSSSASLSGNKNSTASIGNLPPPPPPRSVHAQLKTPPLPPPPADDDGDFNPFPLPPPPSEEACLPPLPPLPVTYYSECAPPVPPHSVGPTPPQRMYLLIPLAPGLRSPQRLLSPPPAPPRSTSLRRSPPPPVPSLEASRHAESNSSFHSFLHEDTNEDDRTISSPSDVGSVICVSSKLTPLPEEVSPTSSPLPPALLIASNENKSSDQQNTGSYSNSKPNTSIDPDLSHVSTAKLLSAPAPPVRQRKSPTPTPPPIPPQPVTVFLTNNSNKNDEFAEAKLTENSSKMKCNQSCGATPPPPPPPKPTFLKAKSSKDAQCNQPPVEPKPDEKSSPTSLSSLMSVSTYGKLVVDRSDIALPSALEEVGRVFTSAIRWGYFLEGVDTIAMYTQIRPIIQHGPQCGIVALSMASQLCGASSASSRCQSAVPSATPTTPTTPGSGATASGLSAAELLESARAEGFSAHGEMFSAESLAHLANMKLGDSVEASVRRGVLEDKHVFLELILAGALILVPYDAQPNHQPGKYNGHKAHWGVVSGALVQSRKFSSGVSSAASFARPDARIDNLWHVRRGYHSSSRSNSRPSSRASSRADEPQRPPEDDKISTKSRRERSSSPPWRRIEPERSSRSMTPGGLGRGPGGALNETALLALLNVAPDDMTVMVLWRQGKSRALVSSTLEELCASNTQLTEYPQAHTDTGFEKDFIIGDVRRGLAGQVVVLNKTTLPLTALSDLLDRLQK